MIAPDALSALLATRRALIFDFDGTIADSNGLHARAFAEALRPFGVTVDYAAIAGLKTREAVRAAFAAAGQGVADEALERIATDKQARVRALIAAELAALPGVIGFLRWARPRYRLAICSSASRATLALSLTRLGLEGWFDPVICAEDVAQSKPMPEGYLRALSALGCTAAEALAFEDSASGLHAATAAGIEVVDVTPPFQFPVTGRA